MATEDEPPPIGEPSPQRASIPEAAKAPTPEKLMAIIRFLAKATERVVFSDHAEERMLERGIYADDVYRALDRGYLKGGIRPGAQVGEWVCKVAHIPRGSREIGVATVVIRTETLWIKTVEWEDRK